MSFRPSDITKGGQITAYRVKMFNQVNNWFSFWIVTVLMGASLLAFFLLTPPEIVSNGLSYWIASLSRSFLGLITNDTAKTFSYAIYRGDMKLSEVPLTLGDVLRSQIMKDVGDEFLLRLEIYAGGGATLSLIIYFILMFGVARIGKKETAAEYISGMKLTDDPKVVNKLLAKNHALSPLKIGPLHLVKNSEIQNFLIHGTIGTGKSTIIRYVLDHIRKRGDRFIIFDPGSTFIKTHYDARRDFILDPHDARCANWDLWEECNSVVDYENFASSLIPIEGSSDPFWVSSSRTICADTAMKMSRKENPTIEDFLHTILSLSLKSLREFLKNTPSANLVEEKIEKTAISIRSVTTNYAKALRFLQGVNQGQAKFSIREWMQDSRHSHSGLFISTKYLKSTRPLISMWLSMATSLLQTMGENRDRRVWFIVDEAPSLQKIPGFREVLADARKYGGCFILGIQNGAQMSDTYGRDNAKAILDLMNTRAYGRSPSSEQAKDVQNELGYQRRWEAKEQNSFGLDQVRDGISIGRDKVHEPIVDYEEIMRLPDLRFYFRLPGEYPVLKMDVPYRDLPKMAEGFIERHFQDSLSPLLEKIIDHNEKETPADFSESASAGTSLNAATAPEKAEQPVVNVPATAPNSASANLAKMQAAAAVATVKAASETLPAPEVSPVMADAVAPDNVTDIFARVREKTCQAEQGQPAAAEPVKPQTLEPEVAPEVSKEAVPVPVRRPLKMNLKKLGSESESESDTPEQAHSPVIYQDEDKLIVKDDSEIGEDGKIVDAMAEEEKNILVHRQPQADDHEEPEL
ncbi:type IV conjugative transfer system coupling protein TraD [Erwinia amylovora]|uniref:type IV conjugative transfer system coupling protein TraD n=1 Tax=Erwinia amylovora TaxID=552 RepID=UPI00200A2574|nr:type IV conjugative transfer system coupling protein TraD [Erwinia amylovora]MCK8417608.1 type IV conjugative transfer system coupling protein TraD [Erwinia amylovora]